MRALLYVGGLVAIATAWRCYGDLGPLVGTWAFWSLSLLGAVAIVLSCATEHAGAPRPGWAASLALAFGSAWCALRGDAPGWSIAAIGLTALVLARFQRTTEAAHRAALLATALLTALVATELTTVLDLVRIPMTFVASALAAVLDLAGADAAASDDLVIVDGFMSSLGFRVTPFALGLSFHGLIAAHVLLLSWTGTRTTALRAAPWRPFAYFASACALRFLLLMAISVALEGTREYDDEHFPLETLLDWRYGLALDLVAGLIAARIFLLAPKVVAAPSGPALALRPRAVPVFATAAVAGVLLAGDRVFDCAGATKAGRIAIDEGHSQWEATDLELGRDYYGTESGYNYRTVVEWLELGYGPVRRLYDAITPALLEDFDVLIVKTPTRAFSADESDAIHAWVRRGGGLVLIGDHTNVFGTGSNLNALAEPFGFHYDYDCLFDHAQRFEELYTVETSLARHPILRPFESVRFEVGCSIDVNSADTRAVIVGRGLKSQPIDYRVANFYGKPRDQSQLRCGPFAQLVTRTFGSGRVVAVADSTLFSTFSICIPGRRELVEGMLAYANRTDAGENARRVARVLALLALGALAAFVRGRGLMVATAAVLFAAGSSRASIAAAESWLYPGHPASSSGAPSREVWFERSEAVDWAVERFIQDHERTYDLFLQYSVRTGQFPRLVEDLDTCLAGDAPLVLIDPDPAAAERAPELLEQLRRGRSVIVIESRPNALVDALATAGDIRVVAAAADETTLRLSSVHGPSVNLHVHPPARELIGGEALLVAERARAAEPSRRVVVGARARIGRGNLALITAGACFANSEHGYSYSMVPDADRRRLYEFQYDLLAAASSEIRP